MLVTCSFQKWAEQSSLGVAIWDWLDVEITSALTSFQITCTTSRSTLLEYTASLKIIFLFSSVFSFANSWAGHYGVGVYLLILPPQEGTFLFHSVTKGRMQYPGPTETIRVPWLGFMGVTQLKTLSHYHIGRPVNLGGLSPVAVPQGC